MFLHYLRLRDFIFIKHLSQRTILNLSIAPKLLTMPWFVMVAHILYAGELGWGTLGQ